MTAVITLTSVLPSVTLWNYSHHYGHPWTDFGNDVSNSSMRHHVHSCNKC